jgi:Kef-type K+ transport system membrane component KefB
VLLAETSFRNQVEADIRPFRGLLLGLFFVTTGTNIDYGVRCVHMLHFGLFRSTLSV